MAFTGEQIETLRARLWAYRTHEGKNGRARPWWQVLDDILVSEPDRKVGRVGSAGLFAARFVADFADIPRYRLQSAPAGSAKTPRRSSAADFSVRLSEQNSPITMAPEPAASIDELNLEHPANQTALRLMESLKRGKLIDPLPLFEEGINVNCRDLQTGGTLLHVAAAYAARPVLRLILKDPVTDFLAQDNQKRYASQLAFETSHDYAIGRLLMKKEALQAELLGVKAWERKSVSARNLSAG